jgi:hypothetical protein
MHRQRCTDTAFLRSVLVLAVLVFRTDHRRVIPPSPSHVNGRMTKVVVTIHRPPLQTALLRVVSSAIPALGQSTS